jgi:hypothetical protein
MAMLEDGLKAQDGFDENPVAVKHVVELVADAIPAPSVIPPGPGLAEPGVPGGDSPERKIAPESS